MMSRIPVVNLILAYANRLRFKNLFFLIAGLFILDLLIPDFIPMIDEIILGLLTVLLANWKKTRGADREGNLIEGETIEEDRE